MIDDVSEARRNCKSGGRSASPRESTTRETRLTEPQQRWTRDQHIPRHRAHHSGSQHPYPLPVSFPDPLILRLHSNAPPSPRSREPKHEAVPDRDTRRNPEEQFVVVAVGVVRCDLEVDAGEFVGGSGRVDDPDMGSKGGERVRRVKGEREVEGDRTSGDDAVGGIRGKVQVG